MDMSLMDVLWLTFLKQAWLIWSAVAGLAITLCAAVCGANAVCKRVLGGRSDSEMPGQQRKSEGSPRIESNALDKEVSMGTSERTEGKPRSPRFAYYTRRAG